LVYQAIRKSNAFRMDRRLVDQIQGAAVSSMSNIAEGFSRKGNKEFVQYLYISKSSAAEVQSQLYVALDQGYLNEMGFKEIYDQAEQVSKLDSAFIKYLDSEIEKARRKPQNHKKENSAYSSKIFLSSVQPK
jgi:four helix bundle protein